MSGNGAPTKVLIADGHAMFAQALAEMLDVAEDETGCRGFEVVGLADGGGAAQTAESARPDVVVTEVDGSPWAARETVRCLMAVRPRPGVVVLTGHGSPRVLRAVVEAGRAPTCTRGPTSRPCSPRWRSRPGRPKKATRSSRCPSGSVGDAVDDGQADGDGGCPLSARQLEVLLLAARGLSNLRIGRLLCLSEAIVKRHLANAYERMGVHSRTEATAAALSKGWITERELVAYPPGTGTTGASPRRPKPPRRLVDHIEQVHQAIPSASPRCPDRSPQPPGGSEPDLDPATIGRPADYLL